MKRSTNHAIWVDALENLKFDRNIHKFRRFSLVFDS